MVLVRILSKIWIEHRQNGFIATPGADSDLFPNFSDPNPIVYVGCQRSVGGLTSAVALRHALRVKLRISPLSCKPFYHGCGKM